MFSPAVSGRGRLSSSFSSFIKLLFGGVGGVLGGSVGLVSGGEGFTAFTGDVGVFDDSELLRLILRSGVSLFPSFVVWGRFLVESRELLLK
jgi:hypothetical protein